MDDLSDNTFFPLKKMINIGSKLLDFEEVQNNHCKFSIMNRGNYWYYEKMKSKNNNLYYTIKKVNKNELNDDLNKKNFKREVEIMKDLSHENIIKFFGYFEDKESINKYKEIYKDQYDLNEDNEDKEIYCLIFEYIPETPYANLGQYIEKNTRNFNIPINQNFIIKIFKQMLNSLIYLENKSIVHRNINLDNIILDEYYNIKITNFELSALIEDKNPDNKDKESDLFTDYTEINGKKFISPEIEKGSMYDYKVDIYSLGLVILCLISSEEPIKYSKDPSSSNMLRIIDKNNIISNYDKNLKNLVLTMINDKINKRPSAEKAYEKLTQIEENIKKLSIKKDININNNNNNLNINNMENNNNNLNINNIENNSNNLNINNMENNNNNLNNNKVDNNGLQSIGSKLSDFEEIPYDNQKYTLIKRNNFEYYEKMKNKINNKFYIIKKINKNNEKFNLKNFKREVYIMSQLNSQNFIKYYGYFEDIENINKYKDIYKDKNNIDKETGNKEILCLILDFYEKGTLVDYYELYKKKFSPNDNFVPLEQNFVIKIFKQLLDGLKYLHSNKILHRNLVSDNIFFDENYNIKISGFGLAGKYNDIEDEDKDIDQELFTNNTRVGRIDFICPEIEKRSNYNYKADIYSLGLILLYLMSKDNPIKILKNPSSNKAIRNINKKNINQNYNKYLRNLVLKMLNEDQNLRPTSEDAYNELIKIEELIKNPNNQTIKDFLEKQNNLNNQYNINNIDTKIILNNNQKNLQNNQKNLQKNQNNLQNNQNNIQNNQNNLQNNQNILQNNQSNQSNQFYQNNLQNNQNNLQNNQNILQNNQNILQNNQNNQFYQNNLQNNQFYN